MYQRKTGGIYKGIGSFFPVPDLLQEMFHVHFLALHLHHPRVLQHTPRCRAAGRFFLETAVTIVSICLSASASIERGSNSPALDEVFERFAPFDAVVRFIFELGE